MDDNTKSSHKKYVPHAKVLRDHHLMIAHKELVLLIRFNLDSKILMKGIFLISLNQLWPKHCLQYGEKTQIVILPAFITAICISATKFYSQNAKYAQASKQNKAKLKRRQI